MKIWFLAYVAGFFSGGFVVSSAYNALHSHDQHVSTLSDCRGAQGDVCVFVEKGQGGN